MNVWIVKRIRDVRSSKPEVDVWLFDAQAKDEIEMRAYIKDRWPEAMPWGCEEGEDPTVWSIGDPELYPDEFIELEPGYAG